MMEQVNRIIQAWKLGKIVYYDAIYQLTRLGYNIDGAIRVIDQSEAHS
jgi:hypothetical protein